MKYDYCIWDFNGTILDDIALGIYSVNMLLGEQGLPVIKDREEYRSRFDFPIMDYYKKLGFDFRIVPYDVLAEKWVAIYLANLSMAKVFDGVLPTLDFFDKNGIRQTVLSASERNMLELQLEGLGLSDRFEEILGIDNIYGDSKLKIAEAWRKAHPNARTLFIGDTVHDAATAKILDADCFLVSAGHQCPEKLKCAEAQIFPSLAALTEYLEEIL